MCGHNYNQYLTSSMSILCIWPRSKSGGGYNWSLNARRSSKVHNRLGGPRVTYIAGSTRVKMSLNLNDCEAHDRHFWVIFGSAWIGNRKWIEVASRIRVNSGHCMSPSGRRRTVDFEHFTLAWRGVSWKEPFYITFNLAWLPFLWEISWISVFTFDLEKTLCRVML